MAHTTWCPSSVDTGPVITLISIISIIAADTNAFFRGGGGGCVARQEILREGNQWHFGGHHLIILVAEVIGGLRVWLGCIATSFVLSKIFCWPTSQLN